MKYNLQEAMKELNNEYEREDIFSQIRNGKLFDISYESGNGNEVLTTTFLANNEEEAKNMLMYEMEDDNINIVDVKLNDDSGWGVFNAILNNVRDEDRNDLEGIIMRALYDSNIIYKKD